MEIKVIWFGRSVMRACRNRTSLPDSRTNVACDGDQDGREDGKRHRDGQAFQVAVA
ncbi:hypothetical protein ABIB73_004903 [Bradyrhizobium sp. F1.4.3]|uniref:hypothetical protein n=1 Tax=Bradyrhizobium sp. F1.4.3 TaxID=3156356 RepID=UPI003396EED4